MSRASRRTPKQQISPSFWSKLFKKPARRERPRRTYLGLEPLEGRWVLAGNPVVTLETNQGNIDIELFAETQPITVENFLDYVNDDSYIESFFHRLAPNFVLQGGGFTTDDVTFEDLFQVNEIFTNDPIQNEPGRSNVRGTVAMAKLGGDPNSATSQFFVNLSNNSANLDFQNGGFTVFGQVINGTMTTVDRIAALSRRDIDPDPPGEDERTFPDGEGGSILGNVPMFRASTGAPLDQFVVITDVTGNGTVTGVVYKDLNNDGVRAEDSNDEGTVPDEPGLPGITVFADANNNGDLDTGEISAVTNAQGVYELSLPAGTHTIVQVTANSFIEIDPVSEVVEVEIGRTVEDIDFGNTSDILASFTVQVTLPDGTPLAPGAQLKVGDQFKINVFVEDPSPGVINPDNGSPTTGVELAALDLLFDTALAEFLTVPPTSTNPSGVDIGFGSEYQFSPRLGESSAAEPINEVETGHTLTNFPFPPAGAGQFLLFTVNMRAKAAGTVTFATNAADDSGNEVAVATTDENGTSGPNVDPVADSQISFGSTQMTIVSDLDAVDDTLFVKLDSTSNELNVLANDVKNPAGTLTIVGVGPNAENTFETAHGTVTVRNDDLRLIYTPDADFLGQDTFAYTITDGTGAPNVTGQVTVNVQELPDANDDDFFNIQEESTANALDVLTNDEVDVGRSKSVTAVTNPSHGTATIITTGADAGKINYVPTANFFGADSFTYTLSDGQGGQDVATVNVSVSNTADSPTGANDSATTAEQTAVVIDVLANDTDIDNNPASNTGLTVGAIAQGANGTVEVIASGADAGKIRYTPALNFFGADSFTYTVRDGQNNTATATVNVTVTNVADGPTAVNDELTITKNTGPHTITVLANDTDVDNQPVSNAGLAVTAVSTPLHGVAAVASGGTGVTYTPTADFIGEDSFTYTITDGTTTTTATVNIDVLDFVPSTLSGFAYIDANGNGVMDAGELPIEGITVTLAGAGVGGNVNTFQTTGPDGSYQFADVAPGNYTITETPPLFLEDGSEAVGTASFTTLVNDQIATGEMPQDTQSEGNNFGELRRAQQFNRLSDFFARRGDRVVRPQAQALDTIQVALQGNSTQLWMTRSGDWRDVDSVKVELVSNGTQVQIEVTENGQVERATIPLTDTEHVQVRGAIGNAQLLQITGSLDDFTFTEVNQNPTATISLATYAATEQTSLTLAGTGLSIADADAGTTNITATVAVVAGVINATAGTTGVTVAGSGTTSVTLTGTLAAINNLLAGNLASTLTYINNSQTPAATDTLTLTVNDGVSGSVPGTDTATINVTAVNDAPTATITPPTYTVAEQTSLVLAGTGLSIADVDAASASVTATVSVVSGTLTSAAGTTGVTVAGSGTATVTLTGTLAQINSLLSGSQGGTLSYLNDADSPVLSDTLTLSVNDGGNTGTGGALTGSDTASISITPANDGPTATITPASYNATEQTTFALAGTGLSIADPDAGTANVTATVSVVSGTLAVSAGTTGVIIANSGTNSVTLTGTVTQVNNLLAGNNSGTLNYLNSSDTPAATDTLTLLVNDNGNTGTGGNLTASDTATINVAAVNDAPTAAITPASYDATEGTALVLHGTGLLVDDVDAAAGTVTATVSVVSGTLAADAGTTGATVSGSGTIAVTLSGTLAQINSLLAGTSGGTLSYNVTEGAAATDTLTLAINDEGNTGSGGDLTASDTATINVTAVNDAPTATITQTSYLAIEDAPLNLHGTGLSIADVDAGTGAITATVSVEDGTLSADAGTTGVVITGTGTNSIGLAGTLAQINAFLAGDSASSLTYLEGAAAFPDTDTLTLAVNDEGNTGTGGDLTASDTATINVQDADNDAPTATIAQASYVTDEGTAVLLHGTGMSIADPDAGDADVTATISVDSGSLTVQEGTTNVTVSGNLSSSVTLVGTIAEINQLLAGNLGGTLTYVNNENVPPATATLTLAVDDGGNTGTGGPQSDSDIATINITAVNDAPTATITLATYNATEQVTLQLAGTGLSIADADAGGATVTATLAVVSGILNASAGLTGVTVVDSGTSTVTLTGTIAQINDLLAGNGASTLAYEISTDAPPASDTLTLGVDDGGNTGTGGAATGSDTAAINITAVNDDPTAVVDTATTAEETATHIDVFANDFDVDNGLPQSNTGLEVQSLDTTGTQGTAVLETTGPFAGQVLYTPPLNFVGDDTFSYTVQDPEGNTSTATVTVTVTAVNDGPTATITQDTYLAIDDVALNLHGTGLSMTDVDAGAGTVTATLSVTSGTLTAAEGITGVTVSGSGTNSVELSGTVAQINALLAGTGGSTLTYLEGATSFPSTDTLTLLVNDGGNTGTGGELTASDTATIDIQDAVNDPPTATITPASFNVNEGESLTLAGTGLAISDVDAGTAQITATVSVVSGVLTANAGTTGVAVSGSGTNSITLDGTLAQINRLLAAELGGTLSYLNDLNEPPATDTLTLAVDDLGNTGSGGSQTSSDTATINITAVNDAPTATITLETFSATEQVALSLAGTGLSIADADAAGATVSATLTVVSGTLTADAGTTGVVVGNSGTNSVSLSGTIAEINDLLAGNNGATISYLIDNNAPPATDTLTLDVNDAGNTGTGGPQTGDDTATINITAVNDDPTAVADTTSTPEETEITIDVLANDFDVDNGLPQNNSGLELLILDTTGTQGTAEIVAGQVQYTPALNFAGDDTFGYTIRDAEGNTSTATVTVTVTNVNDNPTAVNHGNSPETTTDEDTVLSIPTPPGVLEDATDPDVGDVLVVSAINGTAVTGPGTIINLPSGAIVIANPDGTGSYNPNGQFESLNTGETDTDTFTYTVSDGNGGFDTKEITITINGVTDSPPPEPEGEFSLFSPLSEGEYVEVVDEIFSQGAW